MMRRLPQRAIALARCERDLKHAIDLAQEAVSLALLAELAACEALATEACECYKEAVGACPPWHRPRPLAGLERGAAQALDLPG